jgi:regulator of protease activity HflC (stomatin/prohibitin superfamily)
MQVKTILKSTVAAVVAVIGLTVIGGSFYTVDEGERGVILRNGKVIGTASPGLNFKMPIVDSVQPVTVQSLAQVYKGVLAYSQDQQTAQLAISVNYKVPAERVAEVYSQYGSVENMVARLVERQLPEEVKATFGKFSAATAIKERDRLSAEIQAAVKKAVIGPIVVESVQLENVDFSEAYEKSIEQRMLAEVEVQKIQQNAEREKVQAEILVIQAKAEADSTKLRGDAEAHAINARGKALRDNPSLVELVAAEKWNGVLPTTMVPGSAVPFVNVK